MSLITCFEILFISIPVFLFVIIPKTVIMTGIIMFIVVTVMKRKQLIADKETGLEESDQIKIMRIFKRIFVCIFIIRIILWFCYVIVTN